MVRTEAPALGESRWQQLLPLLLSTAPAPDPTRLRPDMLDALEVLDRLGVAQRSIAWALLDGVAPVWSKYSNAQRVSSLHLSEGCLNLASRSDTYFFRERSSLPAARPGSRFEPAVRTPGGPVARHPQPRGRKPVLRREIPWILRGFQGRLSC